MKIRTQGARAADTDVQTYSRQIDELEKKLAVDQAAQSSLVAESLKGQTEQSAAFTQQRIENAISANATMGAIGRKQAELSIQLNELVARSEIDKYTSNEARAVAGAALEVQVARQKLDQIGALEAAESQKRIQLLREKSAAIPSTADDTSGGRERLAIAGQIAQVQGESDHKQIELRGALYAAQEKYKASVITAEREISALVIAGFDRLDDEWKQAQQRVKEYTEARAKAETKASETESAGAGKAASLRNSPSSAPTVSRFHIPALSRSRTCRKLRHSKRRPGRRLSAANGMSLRPPKVPTIRHKSRRPRKFVPTLTNFRPRAITPRSKRRRRFSM
jgi:hypothetical protein